MEKVSRKSDRNQLTALSQLFSARVVYELSRKGKSPILARLLGQSSLVGAAHPDTPIRTLFDEAFSLLKRKSFRDEYTYKSAIAERVLLGRHSLNTAVMLTEFRVGNSKVDVAVLNGTSTAYEIKSERDSIKRIEGQIRDYRKVFAQVNIICGSGHVEDVRNIVPPDVGILTLSDRHQISTIRKAVSKPKRTNSENIFEAIRLSEAGEILKLFDINMPEVPNTMAYSICKKLFLELAPEEAHSGMVEILNKTRSMADQKDLINLAPTSLRSIFLSVRLKQKEQHTLLTAINTPIKTALSWG